MRFGLLLRQTEKQLNRQLKIILKQNIIKRKNLITQLGIGEALITMLNEKGIPTPLVHTDVGATHVSRMDILSEGEIVDTVNKSKIKKKYDQIIDTESAYEILNAKLEEAAAKPAEAVPEKPKTGKPEKSMAEKVLDSPLTRQVGRTAANIITRSLLGALGLGGRTTRKTKSWF